MYKGKSIRTVTKFASDVVAGLFGIDLVSDMKYAQALEKELAAESEAVKIQYAAWSDREVARRLSAYKEATGKSLTVSRKAESDYRYYRDRHELLLAEWERRNR